MVNNIFFKILKCLIIRLVSVKATLKKEKEKKRILIVIYLIYIDSTS